MWPYQAERLSDLLAAEDLELFLGAASQSLSLPITLFDIVPDGSSSSGETSLTRHEPSRRTLEAASSAYVSLVRWGRRGGSAALEGGELAWRAAEERLAQRLLEPQGPAGVTALRSRSPLGTMHCAAPVLLDGRRLGVLVAGGFLEDETQRARLSKIIGKLGKLTQGEVRSLEESGGKVEAEIRPASDSVREELLALASTVPVRGGELSEELLRIARALESLAKRRIDDARRALEERHLEEIVPEIPALPAGERELRRFLERGIAALARVTRASHLALFALPPRRIDDELAKPAIIAAFGLEPSSEQVADRAGTPFLEIDTAPFEPLPAEDPLDRARASVSALIDSLKPSRYAPSEWKDALTKSELVIATETPVGSPWVLIVGPLRTQIDPGEPDLRLFWKALERLSIRFQIALSESGRRQAVAKLSRYEDRSQERRRGPLSPQRFDFRKLIDAVLAAHEEAARERGISFDTKGLPDRMMVHADRPKLGHVLDLLLDWATRHARPASGGAAPSVIVQARRGQGRNAWQVTVDVLSEFLTREDRLRMLRRGGDVSKPADASAESPSPQTTPSISFSDAQRILGWHGGKLDLDSVRTEPDAADPNRWMGRTVFVATFREVPSEEASGKAKGDSPRGGARPRGPRSRDPKREGRRQSPPTGDSARERREEDARGARPRDDETPESDEPRERDESERPADEPRPAEAGETSSAPEPHAEG